MVLPSTTCDAKTPGANAVVERTSSVGSTSSPALSTCPCERSVTVSLRASTTCVPVAVKNDRSVPSASRSGRSTSSAARPTAASSPASPSSSPARSGASRSAEAEGVKRAVGRSAAAAATAAAAQPDTSSRWAASGPGASASTTVTACTTAVPVERSSGRETSVGIAYSYWSTPGCTGPSRPCGSPSRRERAVKTWSESVRCATAPSTRNATASGRRGCADMVCRLTSTVPASGCSSARCSRYWHTYGSLDSAAAGGASARSCACTTS
ncbi:Uncharacterised protein [Mycobacteroides abscessus]|nr:Uncharacterised protein [Mycobacteroides abscessus]